MNASKLVVLIAGVTFGIVGWSESKKDAVAALDEIATQSGLVRTENKKLDLVYRRPDATLTSYKKLQLKPVDVYFSRNFDPGAGSVLYKMNPPDRERIKRDLGELFLKVFKEELEKAGYQVVAESGPDVLEVRAAIVNLYITAPDTMSAGRSKVYTTDSGEMTLVIELHDSVTGTILAQAYDRRGATGTGTWNWSNRVTNSADARQIIKVWAGELRRALDASREP